MDELVHTLWLGLAAGVYPLWLAAGALDYACHRRERIETSTGRVEPLLHLAQSGQLGLATLGVLFLALTPALLWCVALSVVAHTATAWADIAYSVRRRRIGATEQLAHALLIGLPLVAASLLACLRLAGDSRGARGFELREPPFPYQIVAVVLLGGVVVAILPGLVEWWRAARDASRPVRPAVP